MRNQKYEEEFSETSKNYNNLDHINTVSYHTIMVMIFTLINCKKHPLILISSRVNPFI